MAGPSLRLWVILSICLILLIPIISAEKGIADGKKVKITRSENEREGNPEDNSKWDDSALDVEVARGVLQSLESSSGRFSRFDKKSGIVGATAYYAKKGFFLLFMNGPRHDDYLNPNAKPPKLSKPLAKAVKLLEGAARQNNPDAIYLLAEMNFYGNFTHPRNFKEAFRRYYELASTTGNSSAQHMVGFMYATGIGNAVERDQAKALMYHTFAARGGNTKSEMTVAYRHHAGIGTPRNCNEAAIYYKKVADKAVQYARSGPPGGLPLVRDAYRIADENGGVYGEGASYTSSGPNARKSSPNSDQNAAVDDVLEYIDLMSRKGDLKATFSLGKFHYEGSRTVRQNFKVARRYFMKVARKYWSKDDKIISDDTIGTGKVASKAAAYIGRLYLRGEGVQQDFQQALRWFKLGLKNGDAFCQYEMGIMYLHGHGVKKDAVIAADYFKQAAQQDWPAAQVHLGKLFLDQGDLQPAITFFDMASRHGHIEAIYHLAEINNNGVGRERSCGHATAYYKIVSEKAEALHSSFEEANRAYDAGDKEAALIGYMMAAEQGYEQAQANVAYILDEHKSIFSLDPILPWKSKRTSLLKNAVLALVYWTRSAKQSNIDSMVKMGDYYLHGYGVEADLEKAATCYQSAAELQQSAQALWNLGWMHENGIGVEQDFHLAKRLYDQALESGPEAYFPGSLSLMKLRMRSYWNTLTNGKVNSIQPEPETREYKTWSEWLARFLEADRDNYEPRPEAQEDIDPALNEPMPGGDDYYDDIDEGVLESLLIISLAGALAFLVYYRQLRQQNHRRDQDDARRRQEYNQAGAGENQANPAPAAGPANPAPQPGQQADGGFFPPPDDPNFDAWRVGGVGH